MPAVLCSHCKTTRALVLRPKTRARLCSPCFQLAFETEIHETIIAHSIFQRGERVAIGASGGKDSTVLASVLHTLNKRYDYGLELVLLSIDEGIKGYRDDSLRAVEALGRGLELEWKVLGYETLYGWTMDQVVAQVGKKGNCTYCGVWRRQALDRGAGILRVKHVVTGHNADDVAETVLMNLLRGDLPRLGRATSIVTESAASPIKRSKPLKYAYEKEIVLYAHHKKLDYFSTECIYSPEAFRGSARALIKSLERVRPSAILDIVRSGEDMAKMTPSDETASSCVGADDDRESIGGCGSANGRSGGGEMAAMEQDLRKDEKAESRETEVTIKQIKVRQHNRHGASYKSSVKQAAGPKRPETQMIGKCVRCGYLTSQEVCKACTLLEGLNRNRPKVGIEVVRDDDSSALRRQLEGAVLSGS